MVSYADFGTDEDEFMTYQEEEEVERRRSIDMDKEKEAEKPETISESLDEGSLEGGRKSEKEIEKGVKA